MSQKNRDAAILKRMAAILAVPKAEIDVAKRKRPKRHRPKSKL